MKIDHNDPLTALLRDDNWQPRSGSRPYPCGCTVVALCADHASIRAAEHYSPDLVPNSA